MGVAGSVIRIRWASRKFRLGRPADDNASVAAHSSGSAAEASDHIADSPSPIQALSTELGEFLGQFLPRRGTLPLQDQMSACRMGIRDIFEAVDPVAVP